MQKQLKSEIKGLLTICHWTSQSTFLHLLERGISLWQGKAKRIREHCIINKSQELEFKPQKTYNSDPLSLKPTDSINGNVW